MLDATTWFPGQHGLLPAVAWVVEPFPVAGRHAGDDVAPQLGGGTWPGAADRKKASSSSCPRASSETLNAPGPTWPTWFVPRTTGEVRSATSTQ